MKISLFSIVLFLAACGESPSPPSEEESADQIEAPERTPEQLEAEIQALSDQESVAARLRHDALLRIQMGEIDHEVLEVHFFYSGGVERADREFPGHLFAGDGDYVRAFEPQVLEQLRAATGLNPVAFQTTIAEPRLAEAPCVTIAYSAYELGSVESPEGEMKKLSFAVSLMATFSQDSALDLRREIEFFTIDDHPQWIEGQSPRRLICEEPIGRAHARIQEWIGEIALVTPK